MTEKIDRPTLNRVRLWGYFGLYFATMVLTGLFLLTIGALLPYRLRMRIATLWPALMSGPGLRWAAGIRVEVTGRENLPTGPCIAVCNHQSEWETLYLARLLCPASIVMKESLLRIPVYGWGQRLTHAIGIDRSAPRVAMHAVLSKGAARLQAGSNVLIFPEGTRVAPGALRKYARAAFQLAVQSGAPLLPMVQNSGECWRKSEFRPGTIRLHIGKPIDPQGLQADELNRQVEEWSRGAYGELVAPADPGG